VILLRNNHSFSLRNFGRKKNTSGGRRKIRTVGLIAGGGRRCVTRGWGDGESGNLKISFDTLRMI
jgi:hypothetical protein